SSRCRRTQRSGKKAMHARGSPKLANQVQTPNLVRYQTRDRNSIARTRFASFVPARDLARQTNNLRRDVERLQLPPFRLVAGGLQRARGGGRSAASRPRVRGRRPAARREQDRCLALPGRHARLRLLGRRLGPKLENLVQRPNQVRLKTCYVLG